MTQELLEYQVYRQVVAGNSPGFTGEVDCPQVPVGQTWRVDQISLAVLLPTAALVEIGALVYDLTPVTAQSIPVQLTTLQSLAPSGLGPLWGDTDDGGSPITVQGGSQLAIVFGSLIVAATYLVRVQYGLWQGSATGDATPAAGLVPGPTIPPGI